MGARLRRVGLALLVAATVAAAALWLARDLPRLKVEQRLAELLAADVRVGQLRLDGSRRVVVEGLELRRPSALPQLERLRVARVEAHGDLRDLAGGRCERLRLDGVEAVLSPDSRTPRLTPPAFRVALVEVDGARVTLRGGSQPVTLSLDARLHDLGGEPTVEARLRTPHLDAATVALLAGLPALSAASAAVDDLDAVLRLAPDGGLSLEVTAELLSLGLGGHHLPLAHPQVAVTGAISTERLHVVAVPSLPDLQAARLELDVVRSPLRLEHLDARLDGVELGPWLERWGGLPAGIAVDGRATFRAAGSPRAGLEARVELPGTIAATPAGSLGVRGTVEGTLRWDGPVGGGGVRGPIRAELVLEAGGEGRLDALLPAAISATGDLDLDATHRVTGTCTATAEGLGQLTARGWVDLAAPARLELEGHLGETAIDRLADLARSGLGLELPVVVQGTVEGDATVAGDLSTPSFGGEITARGLRVEGPAGRAAWSVATRVARLGFARGADSAVVEATLPPTAMTLDGPLGPQELEVGLGGAVDPAAGSFALDRFELTSGDLLRVDGSASGGPDRPLVADLLLVVPDLERLRAAVRPLADPLPLTLTLVGAVSAELRVTAGAHATWTATGPVALAGGGFASDDGSRVVEGMTATLRLDASGAAGRVRARAAGDAGSFQLLWGTLYADGAATRLPVDVEVDATPADGSWTGRGTVTAPGGLRLAAGLEKRADRPLAAWGELEAADLASLLEASVRPALAPSMPALDELRASGAARARVEGVVGEGRASARGRLAVTGVSVGMGDLAIRDVDVDLPLDVTWSRPPGGGALELGGTPRRGFLRFAGASLRGVELESAALALAVEGDRLTLAEPLAIPLLGGQLELHDLALVDLLRPTRHLATSVELHAMSLERLSRLLALPPLEGGLDGAFPDVRLTPATLRVDGAGRLDLFGGTVTVRNISGREVLGRYPRLLFDAGFTGVDLGQLTQAFDFGEVTGIVEGEITGCELFRGVPLRFAGSLRTVERPGVEQRISLKAVNNLAILGTGSGLGLLDRGLRRLISSYPYAAFGVRMELEQDRFRLRGLERRGGRELFLRGRYPLRLDVVNVAPGSTISFRTMVERLQNLDFSRARTDS